MNRILFLVLFLLSSILMSAQETEMADSFRADGKIYVVIGVVSVIFIAIVVFLFILERKLRNIENKMKDQEK